MNEYKIITAYDLNRGIGYNNVIPWNIAEDISFFKRMTTGHCVIMGRNTFESLGNKPLPNRLNIVLSSKAENPPILSPDDEFTTRLVYINNPQYITSYLKYYDKIRWIIGGEKVYKYFFNWNNTFNISEIYATQVNRIYQSDRHFPIIPSGYKLKNMQIIEDTFLSLYARFIFIKCQKNV
jgi:dihydrofolate reductase